MYGSSTSFLEYMQVLLISKGSGGFHKELLLPLLCNQLSVSRTWGNVVHEIDHDPESREMEKALPRLG
ncbi:Glutaredoxin protein [Spatholobus suberectus]|nr:Glutaredoxin protein [Spatholobus suberectus]